MISHKKHENSQKTSVRVIEQVAQTTIASLCLFVFFVAIEMALQFQP